MLDLCAELENVNVSLIKQYFDLPCCTRTMLYLYIYGVYKMYGVCHLHGDWWAWTSILMFPSFTMLLSDNFQKCYIISFQISLPNVIENSTFRGSSECLGRSSSAWTVIMDECDDTEKLTAEAKRQRGGDIFT